MKTVFVAFFFAALVTAQPSRPASVQASATASVSVKPDQARIQIGVISQAPTASAAASQNASLLQAALDKLKAAAGPQAEVKTVSYSLTPNYDFQQKSGSRTIKGYTANNLVEVVTGDLASVGKIVDAATQSGANEIQSLQFTLKDGSQARAQALRKAALHANAEATAMASALSLKLGKVIYLDEGGQPPIRPLAMASMMAADARTSIEQPQGIEVQATVTLTVALEQ